jgi:hypothetical protein
MQIGGAAPYSAPAALSLPARPVAASVSPDSRTNASSAPAGEAPQALAQEQPGASRTTREASREPRADRGDGEPSAASARELRLEQLEIARLSQRDQEVRAHEQAHAAVGGRYTGAPSYTYTRGPDGRRYAVAGEVSIDSGPVPNDPEATLRKMEIVLRAALAPAEPSAQDLRIAAQAQVQMAQARTELAQLRRDEAQASREAQAQRTEQARQQEGASKEAEQAKNSVSAQQDPLPPPSLEVYQRINALPPIGTLINMQA